MSGDTQSRHCLWLMLAVSLLHRTWAWSRRATAAACIFARGGYALTVGVEHHTAHPPVWPGMGGPIGSPVSVSHSRTFCRRWRRPAGDRRAEHDAGDRAGVSVNGSLGLAGVGDPDPDGVAAAGGESAPGLKTTVKTSSVCPVSGRPMGWPVSVSHSRSVLSSLAETMRCPSGLKATPETGRCGR